ncbi:MAG: energy-coupling factor ABC transporter ATP-binding protein, partial [Mycobacteriales bacterium]
MPSGGIRPAGVVARGFGWRHAGRSAWAVRDVDLCVEAGERVLLLGASGAGKSTLLAAIAGILQSAESGEAAGELLVDGEPAYDARHRSGLVLQDPETQLVMPRAGDDVAFGPENHAVPAGQIWARVDEALDMVGFGYGRDRPTAALSGGEKQRLALAGVLAIRPGLLCLDEPTANLDPDGAAMVRASVRRALAATGAGAIVVEQRVQAWLPLFDRVVVLDAGVGLLADGTPDRVVSAYAGELAAAGVWLPGRREPRPARGSVVGESLVTASDAGYTYRGAPAPAVRSVNLAVR